MKKKSEFWKIDGEYLSAMNGYEEIYVSKFMQLIEK